MLDEVVEAGEGRMMEEQVKDCGRSEIIDELMEER